MKISISQFSQFSVENKIFVTSPYKLFFFFFLLKLMQPDITSVPGLQQFSIRYFLHKTLGMTNQRTKSEPNSFSYGFESRHCARS